MFRSDIDFQYHSHVSFQGNYQSQLKMFSFVISLSFLLVNLSFEKSILMRTDFRTIDEKKDVSHYQCDQSKDSARRVRIEIESLSTIFSIKFDVEFDRRSQENLSSFDEQNLNEKLT